MAKYNAQGMAEFNPTLAQVQAFQALRDGFANRDQQQLALECMLRDICLSSDVPFIPGGIEADRATYINMGRQTAGLLIRNMLEPGAQNRAEEADKRRQTNRGETE